MVENLTESFGLSDCQNHLRFWFRLSKATGIFVSFILQNSTGLQKPYWNARPYSALSIPFATMVVRMWRKYFKYRSFEMKSIEFAIPC